MLGAVFANDARLIACALPIFEIGAERARMRTLRRPTSSYWRS